MPFAKKKLVSAIANGSGTPIKCPKKHLPDFRIKSAGQCRRLLFPAAKKTAEWRSFLLRAQDLRAYIFQILSTYSWTERSAEKMPERAMFTRLMRLKRS